MLGGKLLLASLLPIGLAAFVSVFLGWLAPQGAATGCGDSPNARRLHRSEGAVAAEDREIDAETFRLLQERCEFKISKGTETR